MVAGVLAGLSGMSSHVAGSCRLWVWGGAGAGGGAVASCRDPSMDWAGGSRLGGGGGVGGEGGAGSPR